MNEILRFIALISITILLIFYYFPNIPLASSIPKGTLILLIIVLCIFSILFRRYIHPSSLEIFKWKVLSTIYLLFLMVLLTILGGKSTVGIAFNNVFLWIALLLINYEMFSQWKKVKKFDA
ncbi:hypothetical protein E2636_15490 [Paenisporosarcina antarctica]|uniref:Uncharacterized protein n=1 Tax=Paenisporosarcina antarctica TaxID=417367 RepID=A0A4P7A2Y4_9BACL|nr:hypothetical protein E2636_15490 [Paenisporosarcina antarctica]